jgi:hypothetical protein
MTRLARTASMRKLPCFRVGLILLMLLGAPINLALPDAMAGMPMPPAAMTAGQQGGCPLPGGSGNDHGSLHDHGALCLFCTAFGGPSLAGTSLELATQTASPPAARTAFALSDPQRLKGRLGGAPCCRGPPATV